MLSHFRLYQRLKAQSRLETAEAELAPTRAIVPSLSDDDALRRNSRDGEDANDLQSSVGCRSPLLIGLTIVLLTYSLTKLLRFAHEIAPASNADPDTLRLLTPPATFSPLPPPPIVFPPPSAASPRRLAARADGSLTLLVNRCLILILSRPELCVESFHLW